MTTNAPPNGVPTGAWRMSLLREQPADGLFLLWWLGQSGYALRHRDRMAVIDPYLSDSLTRKYAGTEKPHVRLQPIWIEPSWLAQSLVTVVSASHQHTDHLDADTLRPMMDRFRGWNTSLPLVAPEAWRGLAADRAGLDPAAIVGLDDGASVAAGGFEFAAVPSAHPLLERDDRGLNRYLGYVIRFGGWSVYHAGDTVVYDGMVDRLRNHGPIDVAILPINGKVGNMGGRDAARLAKDIGARLVIPCHYDMFAFNTADPNDEFVPECERLGQPYRVLRLGERFSSAELPPR